MKNEVFISEIYRQNKQWQVEYQSNGLFAFKRSLYHELITFLQKKQILSIVGIRRVGKTILLKQIINYLLNQRINPKQILFLSFDEALITRAINLTDYLNYYIEQISNKSKTAYIFLDEIQYIDKWQHIIKRYYDTEHNIKFVISGSSSLFIKKKTTESLVGRIYEFTLPILSFSEYLDLKCVDKDILSGYNDSLSLINRNIYNISINNFINQHRLKMQKWFENYLLYGQFPEMITETNYSIIKKYLSESIYKKTLEYDIPKIFGTEMIEDLKLLFRVLINETGNLLEIKNLARELEIDEKTISRYINYFSESFLIHLLYNFSKSFRISKKLSRKIYLGSTNFISAFHDFQSIELRKKYLGSIAENYIYLQLIKKYQYVSFYRKRQDEFDFICTNDLLDKKQYKYIEVKYRDTIIERDFKFISNFARQNNSSFQIVSQKDYYISKNYTIIPIWLFI